jgi:hypothetical protein
MDKAKRILEEALSYKNCDGLIEENSRLEDAVLYAINEALRQPLVSGELNCEHDWLVDMYDHFGFPASRFCDKCNTREAI